MKSVCMAFFVLLCVSCSTDDSISTKDYSAENEQEIIEYIAANNLDATRTDSGLYYVVDEVGEGSDITATSDVSVRYKGMYTNGDLIDERTESGASFNLQQVIPGWTEGLQKFREGGSGLLIIPAHLAYGSNDYNGIKGGSVIVFEIEVIDYAVENRQEILDYISENNLDAIETASGLFYVIDEEGTGDQPSSNSSVTVKYTGYYTDGTQFDKTGENTVTFDLNSVIDGWKEGMQYFNAGGSGKLLIPSELAYGRYGTQGVPGGAVIVFDVELIEVN